MELNLELERVKKEIKENNARKVLIQLPDGLKPRAMEIEKALAARTEAEIFIWLGSCFGACDVPLHVEKLGIDLVVQFGHSGYVK